MKKTTFSQLPEKSYNTVLAKKFYAALLEKESEFLDFTKRRERERKYVYIYILQHVYSYIQR